MDTQQPNLDTQFPEDTPETLQALLEPTYEDFTLCRIHRDVSGDPVGGALWVGKTRAVRVIQYTDCWAVESPPIERKVPDYASDDADEVPHFIEYEMDAEFGLDERQAYELADSYLQGEAELTDDAWWGAEDTRDQTGQQTLNEIAPN